MVFFRCEVFRAVFSLLYGKTVRMGRGDAENEGMLSNRSLEWI